MNYELNDHEFMDLIRQGYDTIPKVVNHLMGMPPDMRYVRKVAQSYEDYKLYQALMQKYGKRARSLEKYGLIKAIRPIDNHLHDCNVWSVTE